LDLERLVTTYRSAGLSVALTITGTAEHLSLPLRLTLYRVVQEALANAARHSARGTSAAVEIGIDDDDVVARVSNEFTSTAAGESGPEGYGLVGLREQTASLGGELNSGPEGDSWVVECKLPIRGAA
jgi:signal transduction histidine kinase